MKGEIITPTKKHMLELSSVINKPVFFISFFIFCFISYFKRSHTSLLGFENMTLQQTNQSFCQKRILEVQGFSETQDIVGIAVCPFKHYKKWQKANWLLSPWHDDHNLRDVMVTSENFSKQCIW